MSLGSFKLSDGWSTYDTYPPSLTTRIPRAFQRFMMAVGNNGTGVHNIIPDARNEGVGVCDMMNSWICVYCKFLLEAEG